MTRVTTTAAAPSLDRAEILAYTGRGSERIWDGVDVAADGEAITVRREGHESPAELVNERPDDAAAGGADRMPERDRPAVDVDVVPGDPEHPQRVERDRDAAQDPSPPRSASSASVSARSARTAVNAVTRGPIASTRAR